ncbi:MAG: SAM-dependent methyltransferase [Bdellovibrionota bacterium]|nr:SAM-dependent methyltransferase [Bdellovibrionota bacterium]
MKGILTLVPTPIDEVNPLEEVAFNQLKDAYENKKEKTIFAIEDLKAGRRRWIRWGLPRDIVNDFVLYNEHTYEKESVALLDYLKKGFNVFLMSDGGLPAFCDPGRKLVDLCHKSRVRVTSTPFPHSISLALALSGFSHKSFWFEGFLPAKKEFREQRWKELLQNEATLVLMDTPYRLGKTLEELKTFLKKKRDVFLALDLNSETEELMRGGANQLIKNLKNKKREFVLIIAPFSKKDSPL